LSKDELEDAIAQVLKRWTQVSQGGEASLILLIVGCLTNTTPCILKH
jgi:hypothetical protein